MFFIRLIFLVLSFLICTSAYAGKPQLVLQITVDQLRGDMLPRFQERFGDGGFRYLLDNGTVYANTWYEHANTLTAVGHATLATGGSTPQHGMAANDWYSQKLGRKVYCIEDAGAPVIGGEKGELSGRSPRNVTSSTFADELVLASGGRSRAFGVSTKDRGAIILPGRQGQAYWYDRSSGAYVTSTWYRDEYPEWVMNWNAGKPADRYAGATWDLLADREGYVYREQDDREFELPRGTLGGTFPHTMARSTGGRYYSDLRYTPWADELTLSFTQALLEAEQLGKGENTDYLSVSFSATDYVGHSFGPNSLEAEDNLLRLDRTLARLFASIDKAVGLDKTLIVLSSDHGAQAAPEHLEIHGFEAGRLGTEDLLEPIDKALSAHYGVAESLVAAFVKPNLYLDLDALARAGIDLEDAETALAGIVVELPGFSHAFTRSDLLEGDLADTAVSRAVLNAFHPVRSGNVYVVAAPHWYFGHAMNSDAATHGTLYSPDTFVPMVFAGPGIENKVVGRRVSPRDLAPTLSAYMGILPPTGSVGQVLEEIANR